jgi:hypothetical protein
MPALVKSRVCERSCFTRVKEDKRAILWQLEILVTHCLSVQPHGVISTTEETDELIHDLGVHSNTIVLCVKA